ncbi:MAG TPA: hypothetical protein VGI54_10015 [Solirubrobacteraceae bacterium]
MHTAALRASSFAWTVDGRPATLADALPGFSAADRVAVVAREPLGAFGAATLLLAAVTAFYAEARAADPAAFDAAAAEDDCLAYPDYFVVHVGRRTGDHGWLEVWPDHKEIVVEDRPEAIAAALADRAVTRLLVPDAPPADDGLTPWTRAGVLRSLRTGLAYAPAGRVAEADVMVTGDAAVAGFVAGALDRSAPWADKTAREAVLARLDGGSPETFRRLSEEAALARLG